MSDLGTGPLLNHSVLNALNTRIGERLKDLMGPEAVLPPNLKQLLQDLSEVD